MWIPIAVEGVSHPQPQVLETTLCHERTGKRRTIYASFRRLWRSRVSDNSRQFEETDTRGWDFVSENGLLHVSSRLKFGGRNRRARSPERTPGAIRGSSSGNDTVSTTNVKRKCGERGARSAQYAAEVTLML